MYRTCCKICGFSECRQHVRLMFATDVCSGDHISFDGPRFYPKPNSSVTILVWIKLEKNVSRQSVFTTIGGNASNNFCPHYVFEIKNSNVRWFHRNEHKVTIFSVITKPLIKAGIWMHLAVTYDSILGIAKVGKRDSCFFLVILLIIITTFV